MGIFNQGISLIKKTSNLLKSNANQNANFVSYARKHISQVENQQVRDAIIGIFDFYAKKGGKKNQIRLSQLDDIVHKYSQCNDVEIKNEIENLLGWMSKSTSRYRGENIDLVENVLDSFNSAEDLYCPLFNMESNVGAKFINKLAQKIAQFLLKFKKNVTAPEVKFLNTNEIGDSVPRRFARVMKRNNKSLDMSIPCFNAFTRYSPLEEFVQKYKKANPKLVEYLYEKSYLSKQELPKAKEFCERINKKFGVKIFDYTFYDFNKEAAYRIEKELEMFNRILKPKESFLDTLCISEYDFLYKLEENIGGYCTRNKKFISLPTWKTDRTLRHELTHAVDRGKRTGKITLLKERLEEDLIKAGAPENAIKYAQTKLAEAKAVLGEYYTPKYSIETKAFMVGEGLPKDLLKLREIDFYDYLVGYKSWDKKQLKIFKQLRSKLGGIIPQEIAKNCLYNSSTIEGVLKLVEKREHVEPKLFTEIFESFIDIQDKKHHIQKIKLALDEVTSANNHKSKLVLNKELEKIKKALAFAEEYLEQLLAQKHSTTTHI